MALAAVAWSTAGLFQRELTVDLATQLAGRALFAMLGIGVFVAARPSAGACSPRSARSAGAGLAVAALMAGSSGAFIAALNYTSVANVLFMQGARAGAGGGLRDVRRRAGRAADVGRDGGRGRRRRADGRRPEPPERPGFALSLLMSISFAGTIVITRHQRQVSMAPATWLSQAIVFLCAAPFATTAAIGRKDLALLAGLGVTQIGLGLIFLTIGARLIPAAEVALITLLEIVLGPLWVWIALGEQPSATTLAGGAIVLAAVVIQATGEPEEPPVPPP